MKLYYSLHGDPKDGWRLMVYEDHGTHVSSHPQFMRPKEFNDFEDVMKEFDSLGMFNEETPSSDAG